MHKTYKNEGFQNHNTSIVDKKNHLTSATCNYLFTYKDQLYLIKSQDDYFADKWRIHKVVNKDTGQKIMVHDIPARSVVLNRLINTFERLLKKNFKTKNPFLRKNEWEEYVLPIIKRYIDKQS